MDIAAYASKKAMVDAQNGAAVKIAKGAQDHYEAVLNILLGGIQNSTARAPEQTGQQLNISA